MDDDFDELDDDSEDFDEDLGRYESAVGWEPPDQWAKLREKAHRIRAEMFPEFPDPADNPLVVRSGNDIYAEAEELPPTQRLFGNFWMEGELAILFADTGMGKSVLAVQIAESIARGVPIEPFEMTANSALAVEVAPEASADRASGGQPVLYLDFELSKIQFTERYTSHESGELHNHQFHPNFNRATLLWNGVLPDVFKDFGQLMYWAIEERLRQTKSQILIIDNLSFLNQSNTAPDSALRMMNALKHLKQNNQASILVLAHTPKRPFARPLTVNDLAGSKMLANFADNIFAIGESMKGPDVRYIKHIKPRNNKLIHDAANVAVARIEKPSNFLKFTFEGFGDEREHLIRPYYNVRKDYRTADEHDLLETGYPNSAFPTRQSVGLRRKLIARTRELHEAGHSQRQIANALGIGKGTVMRYLRE